MRKHFETIGGNENLENNQEAQPEMSIEEIGRKRYEALKGRFDSGREAIKSRWGGVQEKLAVGGKWLRDKSVFLLTPDVAAERAAKATGRTIERGATSVAGAVTSGAEFVGDRATKFAKGAKKTGESVVGSVVETANKGWESLSNRATSAYNGARTGFNNVVDMVNEYRNRKRLEDIETQQMEKRSEFVRIANELKGLKAAREQVAKLLKFELSIDAPETEQVESATA